MDVNRFVHPGLLDCVAAQRALQAHTRLDVKTLSTYFTRHIENRANAVQSGASHLWGKFTQHPTATRAKIPLTLDHPAATMALTNLLQTQMLIANPYNQNPNNNRNIRGRGRGGRGGGSNRGNFQPRGNNHSSSNTRANASAQPAQSQTQVRRKTQTNPR